MDLFDFPDRVPMGKKAMVSTILGALYLLVGSLLGIVVVLAWGEAVYHWTPESLRVWYAPFLVIAYTIAAILLAVAAYAIGKAGWNELDWARRIRQSNANRIHNRAYLFEAGNAMPEDIYRDADEGERGGPDTDAGLTGLTCEGCGKDIREDEDYKHTADHCDLCEKCAEGAPDYECRACGKKLNRDFDALVEDDDHELPLCFKCFEAGAAHRGGA